VVSEAEAKRRRRISEAMKKRWKDDASYASKVSKGRSGIEPWNKGKRLSEGHKERIRESRRGSSHSKDTREKMSRSQRRRHTAARVLQSVDKIVQAQEATRKAGPPPPSVASLAPTTTSGGGGEADHQKKAMVARYKTMLHDFRILEKEIEPWVSQFLSEHGRKPNLSDVRATKMDWLIQKYNTYNLMKQQLMVRIPGIRGQMSRTPSTSTAVMARGGQEETGKEAKLSAFFSAVNAKAEREDDSSKLESNPRVKMAMRKAELYRQEQEQHRRDQDKVDLGLDLDLDLVKAEVGDDQQD